MPWVQFVEYRCIIWIYMYIYKYGVWKEKFIKVNSLYKHRYTHTHTHTHIYIYIYIYIHTHLNNYILCPYFCSWKKMKQTEKNKRKENTPFSFDSLNAITHDQQDDSKWRVFSALQQWDPWQILLSLSVIIFLFVCLHTSVFSAVRYREKQATSGVLFPSGSAINNQLHIGFAHPDSWRSHPNPRPSQGCTNINRGFIKIHLAM